MGVCGGCRGWRVGYSGSGDRHTCSISLNVGTGARLRKGSLWFRPELVLAETNCIYPKVVLIFLEPAKGSLALSLIRKLGNINFYDK